MKNAHTLILLALAAAVTLCVAACGATTVKTTTTTSTPTVTTVTVGNSGSTGNTGSTGSSGSTGSTGNTGSTGSSGSTGNTGASNSSTTKYPAAFLTAFIKGCSTNGGTKAYCACVIAYIEKNVSYETVVGSQSEISDGKKPSWYTKAISGCLSKI